jgi:hypothetical protein
MSRYRVPLDPSGGDVGDMDDVELWRNFFAIGAVLLDDYLDDVDRRVLARRIDLILRAVKARRALASGNGDGRGGDTHRPPTDEGGQRAWPRVSR